MNELFEKINNRLLSGVDEVMGWFNINNSRSCLFSIILFAMMMNWILLATIVIWLIVHENGHLLAAKRKGIEVNGITILPPISEQFA